MRIPGGLSPIFLTLTIVAGACSGSTGDAPSAAEDVATVPSAGEGETRIDCSNCLTDSAGLYAHLEPLVAESVVPGAVVAVRTADGADFVASFGAADLAAGTPMPVDAVFGIGSVHKLFKWAVALRLVDEGALRLDDLVNDYVARPDLPGVTIRDLMHHSAGLPDIPEVDGYLAEAMDDQTREFGYDEMIDFLGDDRVPGFTVGRDMRYTSFGPLIMNQVVEAASGLTMQEQLDTLIVEPLGLTATTPMGTQPDPSELTVGYADAATPNPFFPDARATRSISSGNGGALHSNGADLLAFTHALFTDRAFLSRATFDQVLAEPRSGGGMASGLGVLQFDSWADLGVWGHAGYGIRSHSTTVLHQLTSGTTVVVLTNLNADVDGYATNLAITRAVLERLG